MKNPKTLFCFFAVISAWLCPADGASLGFPEQEIPKVSILVPERSLVYEGDRIDCTITGARTRYWQLSDGLKTGSLHATFIEDDPLLTDVEQFEENRVTLTVFAMNGPVTAKDSVEIFLRKIYWGDTHLHADVGDGHAHFRIDALLDRAMQYQQAGHWWALDWLVSQSHAFRSYNCKNDPEGGWKGRRHYVNLFNRPGMLTVFMGGEYSQATPVKHTMHLTVIYSGDCLELEDEDFICSPNAYNHPSPDGDADQIIAQASWIADHTTNDVLLFPHHPTAEWYHPKWEGFQTFWIHWDPEGRDRFVRGVELVSKHGSNMDCYSNGLRPLKMGNGGFGEPEKFIEYAVHKWSKKKTGLGTDRVFAFHAATDWHQHALDESWIGMKGGALGRTGVWAGYNDRKGIFDGLKSGRTFAADFQNINVNLRIDGRHAFGNWIDIQGDADVEVTAWAREGSGAKITDLYVLRYDASGASWESEVIDHVSSKDQGLPASRVHYRKAFHAEARDAFWVTVRACHPGDEGLMFINGGNTSSVPRNPYRTWSSPVWIDQVLPPDNETP